MNGRKVIFVLVIAGFLTVNVMAGPPSIVHLGQVLDRETGAPLADVRVIASFEDWPETASKPGVFTTQTDSTGVYGIGFDRRARVLFFISGYDSLVLQWPQEFEGSEQGGCGISLGPVRMVRIKK